MNKSILTLIIASATFSGVQAQRAPQPSSAASVKQTVGVSDFTVAYSRPNLKDRKVFAENSPLAPLGQLWRTGANSATTLESSTDFVFGDTKVPAGKYAVLSVPGGSVWTVILNRNFTQGTDAYKQADDVARVQVVPSSAVFTETFTIDFSNLTDSTANLNLAWSSVNVPVKITVPTHELTLLSFNKAIAEKPEDAGALQAYGNYLFSKGQNLDQALSLADKSIGLKETFQNVWLKARILAKLGKTSEGIAQAQKALTLGSPTDGAFQFYKGQVEASIKDWTAKLPTAATKATEAVKKKK